MLGLIDKTVDDLFFRFVLVGIFLFRFNRNTETRCFGKEAKHDQNKHFVLDSAETSFGSSFGCFESKLVSLDTLIVCMY